jgi:hydrogenase maturation protease
MKIWVAGFGNENREDDAAGTILAGRIHKFLEAEPDLDVVLCLEHQLLPELVEELEGVDLAVFCDADAVLHPEGFSLREARPNSRLDGFNIHSMGPEWLLALAEQMGTPPGKALLLTISGERFNFSETPTAVCAERIDRAEKAFRNCWRQNALKDSVLENMRFTLEAAGSLKSCRFFSFDDDAFLLATGTDAASENWAFIPRSLTGEESEAKISQTLAFFQNLRLPFIWPILPGTAESFQTLLEAQGLPVQGELVAMARSSPPAEETGKNFCNCACDEAATSEDAALWAKIAWRAFGSSSDAPESFINLARGLCSRPDFTLVTASRGGRPVGTYLLSASRSGTGVYYFATLPEARRTGAGKAMMSDIFLRAAERGRPVTLQSTPSGLPFYLAQGFERLFDIPVHSQSSDIF